MVSQRSSSLQIEGKSFDLTFEQFHNGGFVRIKEKGRRRSREVVVSATMARWVHDILGTNLTGEIRSEQKKRFGRVLGWVKVRSNSKGSFLEVGFSCRGKASSIFVPGSGEAGNWSNFRSALQKVVGVDRSRGGEDRRSSFFGVGGSYKAALTGRRNNPDPSKEGRVGSRIGSVEQIRPQPVQVSSEVAQAAAREVAREMIHEMAREREKMLEMVKHLIGSFQGMLRSSPIHISLDLGKGHTKDLVINEDGGKDSLKGDSSPVVSPPSDGEDEVRAAPNHLDRGCDEDGDSDEGDKESDGDDRFSDGGSYNHDEGLLLDTLRESYESQREGLDDLCIISEDNLTDRQSMKAVEESPLGQQGEGVGDILSIPDNPFEATCSEEQNPLVDAEVVEKVSSMGLEELDYDPLDGESLGSKEADDRARIALAEIGCRLTHSTNKAPVRPLQVFSRRNKSSQEVQKTSVYYDKGVKGGLRKGFLG